MTDTRKALEEAWESLIPEPVITIDEGTLDAEEYWDSYDRFQTLLDAEAYLDAAVMLVPEGWDWSLDSLDGRYGTVLNKSPFIKAAIVVDGAETPAEAILAAILKAKEQDYAE